MDFAFFYAPAASDQFDDAADVATHVRDSGYRIAIIDVTSDEFVFAEIYDLQIISIVFLEIALGSRRGTVDIVL